MNVVLEEIGHDARQSDIALVLRVVPHFDSPAVSVSGTDPEGVTISGVAAPFQGEAGEDGGGVDRGIVEGAELDGHEVAEAAQGHDEVELVDRPVLVEEELAHRHGVVALERHDDAESGSFEVAGHGGMFARQVCSGSNTSAIAARVPGQSAGTPAGRTTNLEIPALT